MSDCGCCGADAEPGTMGNASVMFDIEIAASPAKVWKAMTADIGKWWLKDFHCAPGSKKISMEVKVGGRVHESDGKGGGLLWYIITGLQKGKSLTLCGHFGPPFGGPVSTIMTWTLEPTKGGTRLTLADYLYGVVSPSLTGQIEAGWKQLMVDGLKKYIETPRKKAGRRA